MRHRFGEFIVNESTREILSKGKEIHLPPKAFDLLVLLIANRDRAMSKAELQQHLWPNTYVEETNLAGLIAHLRRALRDSADDPGIIRTVYGFGYRFVADVETQSATARTGSAPARFFLTVLGRRLLLLQGENTVGRSAEATIQIDATGISRRHARLRVDAQRATLEDLGSKNGTHLNGQRITAVCPLADGDRIRFAGVETTFSTESDSAATETLTVGSA